MPKITFITADGDQKILDVPTGISVMEAALQNDVPGIDGDCCGAVACGTCHIYVDSAWQEKVGPAQAEDENEMLDLTDSAREGSRLSCQIMITDELDGLVLTTPAAQH